MVIDLVQMGVRKRVFETQGLVQEEVLEYIIQLASGEINTKAMDLGQDDFMFWRRGVSL